MIDRFKFRVWETDQKIMKEVTQITLDKDQTGSMCDVKGKVTAHLVYQPHYILMQCTGLKDKNGKLIYEGDIVSDKSNHIRVVVWEQDCFKYPALKTSRYFHRPILNQLEERKIGLRGKLTFQDAIGKCDKKHFEVIGNIYENKELLEKE